VDAIAPDEVTHYRKTIMKIKSIRAVDVHFPETGARARPSTVEYKTARRPSWVESGPVANPMTRYPRYAEFRPSWTPA